MVSTGHGNRWDRRSILAAIRRFVAENGRRPSADEWKQAGPWPSYNAVRRHFGSWTAAMHEAGFTDVRHGSWISSRRRKRGRYKRRQVSVHGMLLDTSE